MLDQWKWSPRSIRQQKVLDELAARLGVIAVRPELDGGENHTVLFYDRNKGEKGAPGGQTGSCSPFWCFENTDARGHTNTRFANHGELDLRSRRWREILEGAVRLALATSRQREYVMRSGGYLAIQEADETYNDWNREKITAMKLLHGEVFLGEINFYGEQRRKVARGEMSVYENFCGQLVYNGQGAFCVPSADRLLQEMIQRWNTDGDKLRTDMDSIMERIHRLGGIYLIWF